MNFHRNLFATAAAVMLVAACGGNDSGKEATSSETSQSETLPSSLGIAEYNRLRDAIDNDEVPLRVIPRLDPADRLTFDNVDTASEELNDAVADGDFAAADRVFASVPARWRNELTNRANDAAADAYGDGDYATAYRFDRFLNLDNRAFWILTAEYVNGRVVDKGSSAPVENAVVSYTERSYRLTVQTDAAGEFRILLPVGRPSGLNIEHPEYDSKRVFDIETGGQMFTISMGTGFPKLTFRGQVVDAATGEPLAGFPVVAGFDPIEGAPEVNLQQAMGKFGRETDASGRFEITELPTDIIHVIAQGSHDGKLYVFQERNVTFVDSVEQIIEVSSREVRLDVPLIVVGTVRDRVTGEAVANVRVSAGGWKAENTDVNGRFMIQLDTGRDWHLTATHAAYHTSQPQAFHSATPKTIETEFLIDPITTGTILGTAINSVTGEPLANVVIEIAGQRIRTDSRGQFRAEEIESGEVTVNASQSGFRADSEALLLEALQTAEATLELEPITTGVVTGIVVDRTSGEPVAGAAVRAGDKSGITGDDGRFRLEEVEAGAFEVAATKALYEPGSEEVELEAMASVDARIVLNPITWGTVRGTVRHAATEQPLANATVRFGLIEIRTDSDGKFVAEKVPAGSVSAVAALARYHDAQSSFELPRDGEVEQDFKLSPITTGTVFVTVRDAGSGAPVPGATVTIGTLGLMTDAQGRIEAAEVAAGEIAINATANLYEPGAANALLEAAGEVSVDIELTAITYGTIVGKVVDKSSGAPIANVPVRIGGEERRSNRNGEFRAERIPAGSVSVSAELRRYRGDQHNIELARGSEEDVLLQLDPITTGTVRGVVRSATDGGSITGATVNIGGLSAVSGNDGRFVIEKVSAGDSAARATARLHEPGESTITVVAAETVETVIELVPITYGTVEGTVVNATTGEVLVDALVAAGRQSSRTDSQGRFELVRVSAGEISVRGSKPIYVDNALTISLQPGEVESVRLRLEPITWGTVTGIARDAETGEPLPGVDVTVGTESLRSDANGRFRAEKVAARQLQVSGKRHAYEPASVSIDLRPDSARDVELQLKPVKVGNIAGRVVDAKTGEAIGQARVTVARKAAETAADGTFRFDDIGTGRVAVAAKHPDYANGSAPADVTPADTVEITIRLDLRREDVTSLESALAEHGTIDLYGIYFDSGKAQFKPSSLSTLRAVLEVMKRAPDRRFRIAGHTDSDGGDDYNQNLSERRARTVIEWLVDHGVEPSRLDGAGFGETRPAAPNDTESGKALNRRVQLSYAE